MYSKSIDDHSRVIREDRGPRTGYRVSGLCLLYHCDATTPEKNTCPSILSSARIPSTANLSVHRVSCCGMPSGCPRRSQPAPGLEQKTTVSCASLEIVSISKSWSSTNGFALAVFAIANGLQGEDHVSIVRNSINNTPTLGESYWIYCFLLGKAHLVSISERKSPRAATLVWICK